MADRLKSISKFLSKYLRHAPQDLGLTLMTGGYVRVDDLLNACQARDFPVTLEELKACVAADEKTRYSFDDTGELIRANQGHSVEVDLQLKEQIPPDVLYHGTVERFIQSIMQTGLNKGNRHHVHLSEQLNVAQQVAARRGGKSVILEIDTKSMVKNEIKFYQSENGVWLTDSVPTNCLKEMQ